MLLFCQKYYYCRRFHTPFLMNAAIFHTNQWITRETIAQTLTCNNSTFLIPKNHRLSFCQFSHIFSAQQGLAIFIHFEIQVIVLPQGQIRQGGSSSGGIKYNDNNVSAWQLQLQFFPAICQWSMHAMLLLVVAHFQP